MDGGALFTQQDTWLSRRVKKFLGADRPAENNDPELRHDDYEPKRYGLMLGIRLLNRMFTIFTCH